MENDGVVVMSTSDDQEEDIDNVELIPVDFTLTIYQKYFLSKSICSSPHVTQEEKKIMIDTIYGFGNNDSAVRFREYANDRFPRMGVKETVWQSIIG